MFYVFDKKSRLQSWCSVAPDIGDIESRECFVVETNGRSVFAENAFLEGCEVYSDFTYRPVRPSEFHVWNGSEWIDKRTPEQIAEYERSLLKSLTKRQFSLYLYDIKKYDDVMNALNANQRFKIEFETVATIERNSPTVQAMAQVLEWDAETVDNHWKEALKL